MHHIFINEQNIDLLSKTIILDKKNDSEVFNHLVKSLRINIGEKVLCSVVPFYSTFDYLCEVKQIDSENITLALLEETSANELSVIINLYQGISKYDKLEFVIEKAVELGVSTITPVSSEYCIAKIEDKKIDKKLERFNSIAKSAAEQSKRHIIPLVKEPVKYHDLVKIIGNDKNNTYNLLFYENADKISKTRDVISEIKNEIRKGANPILNVIIGPEGGFSEKEIKQARDAKINILSLGDRILRTETATVTALSILMYELS